MNQLEKILQVTGTPNDEDVTAINSQFAATMLGSLPKTPQLDLAATMQGAPSDAVDMVRKMLDFNPQRRMDIEGALKHPYMKQFVTGQEPDCPAKLQIPIDDDIKYTVNDYREKLYQTVVANR